MRYLTHFEEMKNSVRTIMLLMIFFLRMRIIEELIVQFVFL